MGKKLAIKGHPTRGKEVIELLEMMGGNTFNSLMENTHPNRVYYIGNNNAITWTNIYSDNGCLETEDFFTLEEFLEKYPYKVGDKVVYTKFGDNCDDFPVTIESMKWTGTTIEYTFNDCVTCLAKDLKMWNGEPDAVISGIYLNSYDYADEVELNLGDYEIEVRDGKTYAVKKKPVYPKTYTECCKVLGCKANHFFTNFSYNGLDIEISNYEDKIDELLQNFRKLRYCRDAYWKIAGEQMGLNKPWEFENPSRHYVFAIENFGGKIQKNAVTAKMLNRILVFPNEELRDMFYENFKDLIEKCKELL